MIDFPIIDSHIHLLDQKRFGYSWAAGAPKLKRDWTADDLAAYAKPYQIEGFVFVEVDVDMPQYLDEAQWVQSLASQGDKQQSKAASPACRSKKARLSRRRWRRSPNSRSSAACVA